MTDWAEILKSIPDKESNEQVICDRFVMPLIKELGFNQDEYRPQFTTGSGADKVDFALRKNRKNEDIFFRSQENPYLLIEAKARATKIGTLINLSEGTARHKQTVEQLTKYLRAPNCEAAQYGIITNATNIQLFRKHGKIVHPVTPSYLINEKNIGKNIKDIKHFIENPLRALTVCVYNNKGGIGKTTTAINLPIALWKKRDKKVLIVDFDSQRDLTKSLQIEVKKPTLFDCLTDTKINIRKTIKHFAQPKNPDKQYDIIPSDLMMEENSNIDTTGKIEKGEARLRDVLLTQKNEYDYIFIDCPTNWSFYNKSGVYASDVVLIPTKPSDLSSLTNAIKVIKEYIPYINKKRREEGLGATIALPIFFNGEDEPSPALHKIIFDEIDRIIKTNPDLMPYYLPKPHTKEIYRLPKYANIAKAAFSRTPAVLKSDIIAEHYMNLAKEYFLNE